MMCYKDMTFCAGGSPVCANFKKCPRALTDTVRENAKEVGLLISQYAEPTKLSCYVKPEAK